MVKYMPYYYSFFFKIGGKTIGKQQPIFSNFTEIRKKHNLTVNKREKIIQIFINISNSTQAIIFIHKFKA